MNLLQFSQSQITRIALTLSFLTFTACPIWGHANHHHSPKATPSPSPKPLSEQEANPPEAQLETETENVAVEINSPTVTTQSFTQMPVGLGESIFFLLFGSPIAPSFLKNRSQ